MAPTLNPPYADLYEAFRNLKSFLTALYSLFAAASPRPVASVLISPVLARFLEEGVGIHVATRDERLRPEGSRGVAVQVEDDGFHLEVFVSTVAAERLLPNLHANGQAAVVFGRPTDDRACQVKGTFVAVRPARDAERPLLTAQWEGFIDKLGRIGIPRVSTLGWVTWPAVAIRLKATAIFEQTPGPQAGAQLS
jgi:hypothetical protein